MARGKGQMANGKGQMANGKGQRAKGKGQLMSFDAGLLDSKLMFLYCFLTFAFSKMSESKEKLV